MMQLNAWFEKYEKQIKSLTEKVIELEDLICSLEVEQEWVEKTLDRIMDENLELRYQINSQGKGKVDINSHGTNE
jgi:flagellar biosynthesis chaperone FliJ